VVTLQGINISHLGKRKIIFKMPFLGGYVSFLEGNNPLIRPNYFLLGLNKNGAFGRGTFLKDERLVHLQPSPVKRKENYLPT